MSDYQFPPSSPVTHASETDFDPFSKQKSAPRGRHEYPTPNPSSTTGRSSSPARIEEPDSFPKRVAFELPSRRVSINRDFNILNPDASVLRVPLLLNKTQLLIGRSSKSCDFHLNAPDKTVSRAHVKVEYTFDTITLTCLGHNGLGMIVPRVCEVSKTEERQFKLRETGKPLQSKGLSKTIHLDYQHTEFHVSRGEVVTMPRFPNVLLQIRDHVVLVNPDDFEEEMTDEETIELVERTTEPTVTPQIVSTGHETPPHKHVFRITPEEPTPCELPEPKFQIFEDISTRKMPIKRSTTPLANRSTNVPMTPPAKRRAASEEPGSAKREKKEREPERDAEGKLVIDERCIESVSDIGQINNILINHLAFSRLSSTPASFLNTILAVVAKVSLQQLRAILHGIVCIGIIYRQGKDAAGKPLEEEYYYIPEKDSDPERNELVSLIKGHGGLRACRRTHKQYYWKKPAPIKK